MVTITIKKEINKNIEIKVEPIGKPRKIYFLEEKLFTCEPDSPSIGLSEEKIYATFTYFSYAPKAINDKFEEIKEIRKEQGWKNTSLRLDVLHNQEYILEYKFYNKEVYS